MFCYCLTENLYYQWSATLCKWRQEVGTNFGTACYAPLWHSPQCMLVWRARAEAWIMPETYQTFCAATTCYSWQKASCLTDITLPLIIRKQLKCLPFSFSNTLISIKHMKITFILQKNISVLYNITPLKTLCPLKWTISYYQKLFLSNTSPFKPSVNGIPLPLVATFEKLCPCCYSSVSLWIFIVHISFTNFIHSQNHFAPKKVLLKPLIKFKYMQLETRPQIGITTHIW